jgi:methyl-accepting chemotaxis protein
MAKWQKRTQTHSELNMNNPTENYYYRKALSMMLGILLLNIPVILLTAYMNETGMLKALLFSAAVVSLPVFLWLQKNSSIFASIVSSAALMFFSGLMIHFGKGVIEMHFHVFVSLAVLILLAEPLAVLAGAATIAIHHIGFYFLFPESLFNYSAGFGIVLLHAVFVVVESVPAFIIAQKFKNLVVVQNSIIKNLDTVAQELTTVSTESHNSSQKL